MRCLPILTIADQAIRLPLCDATAEALCCAMLSVTGTSQGGPGARDSKATTELQRSLAESLANDPALSLWCALQSGDQDAVTIASLASWLLDALPGCLLGEGPSACEAKAAGASAECDSEGLYELAAESVLSAHAALKSSAEHGSESRFDSVAFAQGLLRGATAFGGEKQAKVLVQQLKHVEIDEPGHEAAVTLEPLQNAELAQYWERTSPIADRVFELAETLARKDVLETRFAAQLQEEKLQALYTLAAGAGHEINNPLGSIAGRAQLLVRDEPDAQRRRTLAKINTQAFRAHEMISDMMLFARPPEPVRTDVDLAELASNVVAELKEEASQRSTVIVCTQPPEAVPVSADPSQVAVALRAMCLNAMEALGTGGRVEISARRVQRNGHGDVAELVVRDDGPGIAPEQQNQLFDPFFSGREAGRGLGFGLSKCWRIVTNHGGTIRVESEPGQGATFTITLPVEAG